MNDWKISQPFRRSRVMKLSRAFSKALSVATASAEKNQHGALILARKGPVGAGINVSLPHPPKGVWSIHAEVAAIAAAQRLYGDSLRGLTLVSARVGSHGQAKCSKPCDACMKAIRDAGISRIVYHDGETMRVEKVRNA